MTARFGVASVSRLCGTAFDQQNFKHRLPDRNYEPDARGRCCSMRLSGVPEVSAGEPIRPITRRPKHAPVHRDHLRAVRRFSTESTVRPRADDEMLGFVKPGDRWHKTGACGKNDGLVPGGMEPPARAGSGSLASVRRTPDSRASEDSRLDQLHRQALRHGVQVPYAWAPDTVLPDTRAASFL